jgi:hypothetical protein
MWEAFLWYQGHKDVIIVIAGALLTIEQVLPMTDAVKANSTVQLITNILRHLAGK